MTQERDDYMRRQEADHDLLRMRDPQAVGRALHPVPDTAVERAKADKDSQLYGTGFLIDDVHVPISRITVIRRAYWPHVTTTELYNDLAQVLRDKGASEEWIAYVMGDLQLAATQYASVEWARGHASGARGEPVPNPQEPCGETE